ncbi:uncharacterized protein LJ206_020495 isoform 1-T2 [Theristicus caerulescens]
MASAKAASKQALRALVGLAEALGTPEAVAAALAEAKAALAEAEEAVAGLEEAVVAARATVARTTPTPGLNAESLYRALGAVTDARASELERELSRNQRRHRCLRVVRNIALVLMLLCAPLLSLDVVREAVGVTQESHLVPCLATVALICHVALQGTETSQRHLVTAVTHQRHQARRYHRLARDAAAAAAAAEVTEGVTAAIVTLETLEEVAAHLRSLVNAVTRDLEMGWGFSASARALGDTVVALGTAMGDKEGLERLTWALEALPGDE